MKVTNWTYWNDDRFKNIDDLTEIQYNEAKKVVAEEIKNNKYKISGESHQYANYCTPVIDNEYLFNVSMRTWGEIMQLAYNIPNKDGMGYVLWAWTPPEKEILPKGTE